MIKNVFQLRWSKFYLTWTVTLKKSANRIIHAVCTHKASDRELVSNECLSLLVWMFQIERQCMLSPFECDTAHIGGILGNFVKLALPCYMWLGVSVWLPLDMNLHVDSKLAVMQFILQQFHIYYGLYLYPPANKVGGI